MVTKDCALESTRLHGARGLDDQFLLDTGRRSWHARLSVRIRSVGRSVIGINWRDVLYVIGGIISGARPRYGRPLQCHLARDRPHQHTLFHNSQATRRAGVPLQDRPPFQNSLPLADNLPAKIRPAGGFLPVNFRPGGDFSKRGRSYIGKTFMGPAIF